MIRHFLKIPLHAQLASTNWLKHLPKSQFTLMGHMQINSCTTFPSLVADTMIKNHL